MGIFPLPILSRSYGLVCLPLAWDACLRMGEGSAS